MPRVTPVRRGILPAAGLVILMLCVGVPWQAAAKPTPPPNVTVQYGGGTYRAGAATGSPAAPVATPTPAPRPTATPTSPTKAGSGNPSSQAAANNTPTPNPAPCGYNPSIAIQWNPVAVKAGPAGTPKGCPPPSPTSAPATALTPATSPPPDLGPYYAQVLEQIETSPGTITAAPPNHTGLVNLPTCFWLTGQAVPNQKQVTMDLKGAPGPGGQQITYHITLTVTLQNISWSFGDRTNTQVPAPPACIGISGGPPTLVAHDYVTYSDPDFMVSASETYGASATITWTDDNGPESPPPVAGPTQTIATAPYPIKVDQEEGLGSG